MGYYYSAANQGFYHDSVHTSLPADARAISDELHKSLLADQAAGKIIIMNDASIFSEPFVNKELTMENVRLERNALLAQTDWTQFPDIQHNEELKNAWRSYRQALRDIPQAFTDPNAVIWPTLPKGK